MQAPFFHRFQTARRYTDKEFSQDLADLLAARRGLPFDVEGVVGWGLPNPYGLSPASHTDRETLAGYIRKAITKFEPRLQQVVVEPIDDEKGFAFRIGGATVDEDGGIEELALKVRTHQQRGDLSAAVSKLEGDH